MKSYKHLDLAKNTPMVISVRENEIESKHVKYNQMMGIFLAFFLNLHQFKIFYSFVNEQVMIRTHAGRNEKWCQFVTAMINHVQYLTIVIFYLKSSQIGLSLLKASLFFFTYSSCQYDIDSGHSACSTRRFTSVELTTKPSDRMTDQ